MDPVKQREIASKGGKAAHQKGTAHEFTSEEARVAGRKGGAASRERRGKPEGTAESTTQGTEQSNLEQSQNAPQMERSDSMEATDSGESGEE